MVLWPQVEVCTSVLQCGICMSSISVFEEPVDMSCGHEFCRACWEGYVMAYFHLAIYFG